MEWKSEVRENGKTHIDTSTSNMYFITVHNVLFGISLLLVQYNKKLRKVY